MGRERAPQPKKSVRKMPCSTRAQPGYDVASAAMQTQTGVRIHNVRMNRAVDERALDQFIGAMAVIFGMFPNVP